MEKLPISTGQYTTDSVKFKQFYQNQGVKPGMSKLKTVSEDFVLKELMGINPQKSTGLDGIAPRFLKDGANQLAPIITHIINLSITQNYVPDSLKHAKVTPLFKKNDKLEVSNYRPISVLSAVSKILEKSVHTQVQSYLIENKLVFDYQSGFRPGFSTDTCLIHLTDFIKDKLSHGFYVGAVLLDVQKAFDSVNHTILCNKIAAIGIDPSWFISYLSHRKQTVMINETISEEMSITCGVPQGGLLAPLLYLIYSNDMSISVQNKLLLYADDSVLLAYDKNPHNVSKLLSSDLESCNSWLVDNQLSLHIGKTECILFGSKKNIKKVEGFNVKYRGQTVNCSKSVKYLGAILDENLAGESMAMHTISKINGRLKFLYRHQSVLTINLRKKLSIALLLCHLDYCSSSWYPNLTSKFKSKLQVMQNKIARFTLKLPARSHIGQVELNSVGLLNVSDRVCQLRLNNVFKINCGQAPHYLTANFNKLSDTHRYNTRGRRLDFHVPSVKGLGSKSFYYQGICDWNVLPDNIKCQENLQSFKKHVKLFLANRTLSTESTQT